MAENMSGKTLSRKTSTLIVVGLLIGTTGLAVTAAATGADTFLPLLRGEAWAAERGLSQRTVALAVHVAALDGVNRTGLEGVNVTVYLVEPTHEWAAGRPAEGMPMRYDRRAPDDHPPMDEGAFDEMNATEIVSVQTDEDGRIVFELERGHYVIVVDDDGNSGSHAMTIRQDSRLGVVYDENGQIHFLDAHRKDLRMHGEGIPIRIQVFQMENGTRHPVLNYGLGVGGRLQGPSDSDGPDSASHCRRAEGNASDMCRSGFMRGSPPDEHGVTIVHTTAGQKHIEVSLRGGFRSDRAFIDLRGPTAVEFVWLEDGSWDIHVSPSHHQIDPPEGWN